MAIDEFNGYIVKHYFYFGIVTGLEVNAIWTGD
jgi:hypothetical protein